MPEAPLVAWRPPAPVLMQPTTIVVSGYPPIQATALVVGGVCLGMATSSATLGRFAPATAPTAPVRARCGACRIYHRTSDLGPNRLGTAGYCPECVGRMAQTLAARHGLHRRVRVATEFWCSGCQGIVARALLCRPDADGRHRYRCVPCRRVVVQRAEAKRRAAGVG